MDDRHGLMAAIIANPDEDTPRHVFADWLQEHGDEHDRARAEFIRSRIAFLIADDASADELETKANSLHSAHAAAWLGELQALWQQTRHPVLGPKFDEGILNLWDVSALEFVSQTHQAAVCKAFPRVGVGHLCVNLDLDDPAKVANSAALEWVTALSWNWSRNPDEVLRALASSPHTFRISGFGSDSCSDAGLKAFADSACWPNLRSFGLSARGLAQSATLAGFVHLLNSERFPKLERLRFLPNSGQSSTQFFECPNLKRLGRLSLGRGTDMSALTRCPHLTELWELSVTDSMMTDADAFAFCDNPAFERLRWVTLSNVNEERSPLSAVAMQRLEDRFEGAVFLFDYSALCLRS